MGKKVYGLQRQAPAANMVAASTVDLSTATGNVLVITGNTTITSFGTSENDVVFDISFTGTPLLTHNATSLKLPGEEDIQIVAGDSMRIKGLGGVNWEVISYQRKDGKPLVTVPDASTTVKGIVELSTDAEALGGSSTSRIITEKQSRDIYGVCKFVTAAKNVTDAGGATNIAHGLGRVPRLVKVRLMRRGSTVTSGLNLIEAGMAVYDGTTQVSRSYDIGQVGWVSTLTVSTQAGSATGHDFAITWDSTNIILTSTKRGSPTSSDYEIWCEVS